MGTEVERAGGAADQSAALQPPAPTARIRWWLPPLATVGLAWAILWSASFPGVPFSGLGLVLVMAVAATVLWWMSIGSPVMARRRTISLITVALTIASIGLGAAGVPLQARFAISRSDLDCVAVELQAGADQVSDPGEIAAGDLDPDVFPIRCPKTVGLFRVESCSMSIHTAPDGTTARSFSFVQTWIAVTDTSAVEYLPDGAIPSGWQWPRPLGDGWYATTCGC